MQFAGQLYDIVPEFKPLFTEYTPMDKAMYYNVTLQLQNQYDKLIQKREDALKAIKDEKVHSIYNPLKQQIAQEIVAANDNLLKDSNYDVLNPTYSQGIYDTVNKKLYGNEWLAAIGNTPQLEEYEQNKQAMLSKGNVENYDDPNIAKYNTMIEGKDLYVPFVNRGIFQTPDYAKGFDEIAKSFTPDELSAFKPIINAEGEVEPFDIAKVTTKIMSQENLQGKFETLRNTYFTTPEGSSFARKVAAANGFKINPDGSIDQTQVGFKDKLNEEFTKMISDAATRNEYYQEKQDIDTLQGKLNRANAELQAATRLQEQQMELESRERLKEMELNAQANKSSSTSTNSGTKGSSGNKKEEEADISPIAEQTIISKESSTKTATTISFANPATTIPYNRIQANTQIASNDYQTAINNTAKELFGTNSNKNYSNNAGANNEGIIRDMVDYFDEHNSLEGYKLIEDNIDIPNERLQNEYLPKISDLLIAKKKLQSHQSSVKQVNREAFEKLVSTKNSNSTDSFKYIPYNNLAADNKTSVENVLKLQRNNPTLSNVYFNPTDNHLVRYNEEKGEIEYISGNQTNVSGTANQTNIKNQSTNIYNWQTVKTAADSGNSNYNSAYVKWLKDNSSHLVAVENRNPITLLGTNTFTDNYNKLSELEKQQYHAKFLRSKEYDDYLKAANTSFETEISKKSGVEKDILFNLNNVSKSLTKLIISDVELYDLPNSINMKDSDKNSAYLQELRSIEQNIRNNTLNLNVYEYNKEADKLKGVTTTYYDKFSKETSELIEQLGDTLGWNNYDISMFGTPELKIDGISRVDGIGGVYKAAMYYDVSDVVNNKDDKQLDNLKEFVNNNPNDLEIIEKGQDGKRYVRVKSKQMLVQYESANQFLYETVYGKETASQLAQTYELLNKGFSNYQVTTLDVDAYASNSNIKVERRYDDAGNAEYRIMFNDINNEANIQTYPTLDKVAETVAYINTMSKEVSDSFADNSYIISNDNNNTLSVPVQSRLMTAYKNVVLPQLSKDRKEANYDDKKNYENKDKIYYGGDNSGITFKYNKDNTDNGNEYLVRNAWALFNMITMKDGKTTFKEGYDKNNVKSFNLKYNEATPTQQKYIVQSYGGKVDLIYKNNQLTIQDASK